MTSKKQPAKSCGCKATPVEANGGDTGSNSNGKTANGEEQVSEEHFSYIKRVGSYLVGRTLGEGSFAKVRLGLHLPTAEKVAIKVLDKHRAANDNYMEMTIRREGRLLRRIRPHPNIVQMYEVMETANSLYLVLELCEGGDFLDLVASRGRLSEPECRMYLRQIIDAVAHLHSFGILHRDLKIENFMLDSTLQLIKIIDLGLSTAAPGGSATRTQCGSPAYAAPELIRSPHYGPEVDVWSVGVDMFAMLTGGLPFTVEPFSIKNLYARMVARDMNPLPPDTSQEAVDLLHRLLEPEPRLRITLQAALAHPWLRSARRIRYSGDGDNKPSQTPHSIKIVNGTKNDGNDPSILDLSIATRASALAGCSLGSLLRDVAAAVPSNFAATYHLLVRHAKRPSSQNNWSHDEKIGSEVIGNSNDCHQKNCVSALSSESVTAASAGRGNNEGATAKSNDCSKMISTNNTDHHQQIVHKNVKQENSKNELEISFIANGAKPNNMTRVTVASHTLHRQVKMPMSLTAAAASVIHENRVDTSYESRPMQMFSAAESEPVGVQTLERRRLRQPKLATNLVVNGGQHHQKCGHPSGSSEKKSAPDVALENTTGEMVQTARYVGSSALSEADAVRWAGGDGLTTLPQCLMTSCCGELPLKTVPQPFYNAAPTSSKDCHRMPSSTLTPPACMQISHIVTKGGGNNEFCQSPRLSNGKQRVSSTKAQQLELAEKTSLESSSGNKEQRYRTSSNVGDFILTAKNTSEIAHHARAISSKTPPPPVAVLTPITTSFSPYCHLQNQNVHHHQTATHAIVKPAVQAVAAAARRVLCGASPQPGPHNGIIEHALINSRNKQAAV